MNRLEKLGTHEASRVFTASVAGCVAAGRLLVHGFPAFCFFRNSELSEFLWSVTFFHNCVKC